ETENKLRLLLLHYTDRDWHLSCTQYNGNAQQLYEARFPDVAMMSNSSTSLAATSRPSWAASASSSTQPNEGKRGPDFSDGNNTIPLVLHLCQLAAQHAHILLQGAAKRLVPDSGEQKARNLPNLSATTVSPTSTSVVKTAREWIISQALLALQALLGTLRSATFEDLSLDVAGEHDGLRCHELLARFCDQHLYFRLAFQALISKTRRVGRSCISIKGNITSGHGLGQKEVEDGSSSLGAVALSVCESLAGEILCALLQDRAQMAKNSLTPLLRAFVRTVGQEEEIAGRGRSGHLILMQAVKALESSSKESSNTSQVASILLSTSTTTTDATRVQLMELFSNEILRCYDTNNQDETETIRTACSALFMIESFTALPLPVPQPAMLTLVGSPE
ncbi:unnamed protein product, partial [Amoebophrya sp. A25]